MVEAEQVGPLFPCRERAVLENEYAFNFFAQPALRQFAKHFEQVATDNLTARLAAVGSHEVIPEFDFELRIEDKDTDIEPVYNMLQSFMGEFTHLHIVQKGIQLFRQIHDRRIRHQQ
jgi:hypothetical protein